MAIGEWFTSNLDKIVTAVLTVAGAVWVAARRFTGRVDTLEVKLASLEREVADLKKGHSEMDGRFREVLELKIMVERQDVLLKTIHEALRDLREDVKRLMRSE